MPHQNHAQFTNCTRRMLCLPCRSLASLYRSHGMPAHRNAAKHTSQVDHNGPQHLTTSNRCFWPRHSPESRALAAAAATNEHTHTHTLPSAEYAVLRSKEKMACHSIAEAYCWCLMPLQRHCCSKLAAACHMADCHHLAEDTAHAVAACSRSDRHIARNITPSNA